MLGQRAAAVRLLRALAALTTLVLIWSCAASTPRRDVDVVALGERTTALTGVPLPPDLESRWIERHEVEPILRASVQDEWSADEVARLEAGLVSMGLWPQQRDLLQTLLDVSAASVSGFYLPRHRTLYVVDGAAFSPPLLGDRVPGNRGREFVVAHELIHAHQHVSHPELLDFFIRWHGQDDAAHAASAAIEGHALRASMELYLDTEELPTPEHVASYFDVARPGSVGGMPAILRRTHTFPYTRGYPVAYREGARLLDRAPASTEQVLHAERRHEDFSALDLTGVEALLPEGCEGVYQNTLGELGISALFDELSEDPDPEIWTGWDGDRYLAASCRGARALLWVTAWDSDRDARLFAEAYAGLAGAVAASAGFRALPRAQRTGRDVIITSPELFGLASRVPAAIRRARVSTLPELRAHFEGSASRSPESP